MHKDITIVTSLVGAGLEREYLLLRELLMQQGHYVMGVHYTDMNCALHPSDIMISLEVVLPRTLNLSRNNWLIPNCEWWDPRNDRWLPQFSKVICKTIDCYNIWCQKVGASKCVYTSFASRDVYRPEIPRELKCLHIAGKSEHKNTEAVCRAWRMTTPPIPEPGQFSINTELPPLTIVSRAPCFQVQKTIPFPYKNVTWIDNASDDEIIQLMNSHAIHIIPSMYEGFGHVIHEGISTGNLVLTTNAQPMNTFPGVWRDGLIAVKDTTPRSLAKLANVDAQQVGNQVRKAAQAWNRLSLGTNGRAAWADDLQFFQNTFMGLVNGLPQRSVA